MTDAEMLHGEACPSPSNRDARRDGRPIQGLFTALDVPIGVGDSAYGFPRFASRDTPT
jgi:hypothetical protein